MKPAIVYISYDGMLEPLGQSQVLAYLDRLSGNYRIHLVSFEKMHDRRDSVRMTAMRARMVEKGIGWHPQAYHKRPTAPATAFDIVVGAAVSLWLVLRFRATIVHARSYVPAAMALIATKLTGAKFLFDIRGFWADERVDAGIWPRDSFLYRITKRLERWFFEAADHVVVLTEASKREVENFSYLRNRSCGITVIPTCADLERFRPSVAARSSAPFVFGYVGSVGTWSAFDEVVACFKLILERHADARLLVVNRHEHELVRGAVTAAGVSLDRLDLVAVEHKEVPSLIGKMHVGVAFNKPVYSRIASAPTKIAEYLGCGIPCLGDTNVGDMAEILEDNPVGVAVRGFTDAGRRDAVRRLLDLVADRETPARCTATARALFSLDTGVARYRAIYERLTKRQPADADATAPAAERTSP